ncbi:MAG: hypothetical protein B6I26_05970 [Desulfobacteraceae bacterium 4572_130]|nr:MAG: hypothetical protein B6I26_05970 [Desulfobacteraceae bacterium 4572_130]
MIGKTNMKNKNLKPNKMNFNKLVKVIKQINTEFSFQVSRAVNVNLTLRNWFVGGYIHEYELLGNDRAVYGEKLIQKLSQSF